MKGACFEPGDFLGDNLVRVFHSGDLGDIVYSLLFCRSLGNIHLTIGPDNIQLREQMTEVRFQWFRTLLDRQPWIKSVEFGPRPKQLDYNLNDFRQTWFSAHSGYRKKRRLFETYPEHFKKPSLPEDFAWLEADPIFDAQRPVVIARSPRFHNDSFPWQQVSNRYNGKMRFVGLEEEYTAWTKQFGKTAEYRPVQNALELANVIAGAELFIGNQSFPMAIALGLNVPVIQETNIFTPDCVFNRPNAIYSHRGIIKLPDLKTSTMRHVVNRPNREGLLELGPCADAYGLGDTLTITPVAAALGKRAVMLMPPAMENLRWIFNGLCPVRITDNFPVFPWTGKHAAAAKLETFGLRTHSNIPTINISPETIRKAKTILQGINNPIVFVPTCSVQWEHVRQRPAQYWKMIVEDLAIRHTVCQFGRQEYPVVGAAKRMPFVDLETLSGIYHLVGNYVGVNTGDHHLMLAAGGRCVVAEPDPIPEFHSAQWRYESPRIVYSKLSHPKTTLDAIKKMGL